MAYKTITGGLCPGGRLRMERIAEMVTHKRINPSLMATHLFKGFDKLEEALLLMKDKTQNIIKPVVFYRINKSKFFNLRYSINNGNILK